ncbi:GMC family oxidoreductase N-terminal domain-containing protein [Pseudomonas sp. LS1212]|nr:GMC family oxidoreductase N-terminal domain-containing protein [Pseudomonas sp. LS1212]
MSENPKLKVLLVEAGGRDRSLIIDMPAALPFAYGSKRLGWQCESGPEPHLNNRVIDENLAKSLAAAHRLTP